MEPRERVVSSSHRTEARADQQYSVMGATAIEQTYKRKNKKKMGEGAGGELPVFQPALDLGMLISFDLYGWWT